MPGNLEGKLKLTLKEDRTATAEGLPEGYKISFLGTDFQGLCHVLVQNGEVSELYIGPAANVRYARVSKDEKGIRQFDFGQRKGQFSAGEKPFIEYHEFWRLFSVADNPSAVAQPLDFSSLGERVEWIHETLPSLAAHAVAEDVTVQRTSEGVKIHGLGEGFSIAHFVHDGQKRYLIAVNGDTIAVYADKNDASTTDATDTLKGFPKATIKRNPDGSVLVQLGERQLNDAPAEMRESTFTLINPTVGVAQIRRNFPLQQYTVK